jgi:hypothetical protein
MVCGQYMVKKRSSEEASEAAKKAWITRRKNKEEDDPKVAEAERQEALRILEELKRERERKG